MADRINYNKSIKAQCCPVCRRDIAMSYSTDSEEKFLRCTNVECDWSIPLASVMLAIDMLPVYKIALDTCLNDYWTTLKQPERVEESRRYYIDIGIRCAAKGHPYVDDLMNPKK